MLFKFKIIGQTAYFLGEKYSTAHQNCETYLAHQVNVLVSYHQVQIVFSCHIQRLLILLLFLKSENFIEVLAKKVFLVGLHGCSGTAVDSMNLGTIGVWLYTRPTWVLDSSVTLSMALNGVTLAR